MHGLSNIAGERQNHVTIGETTYQLSDMTLEEIAEKEQAILALKPSPMSLLSDLPPLPDEPVRPIPPAAKDPPEAKQRHRQALAAYQRAEQVYNEALRQRSAMEDRIFKLAQRPRVASYADGDTFDASMAGLSWRFWRATRANHEEIASPLHARQIIEPAAKYVPGKLGEIILAVEASEGLDILKNSASPAAGPGTANTSQTETSDASPGPSSTEELPTDTSGVGTTSTS